MVPMHFPILQRRVPLLLFQKHLLVYSPRNQEEKETESICSSVIVVNELKVHVKKFAVALSIYNLSSDLIHILNRGNKFTLVIT